jgi:hypothetical protein
MDVLQHSKTLEVKNLPNPSSPDRPSLAGSALTLSRCEGMTDPLLIVETSYVNSVNRFDCSTAESQSLICI